MILYSEVKRIRRRRRGKANPFVPNIEKDSVAACTQDSCQNHTDCLKTENPPKDDIANLQGTALDMAKQSLKFPDLPLFNMDLNFPKLELNSPTIKSPQPSAPAEEVKPVKLEIAPEEENVSGGLNDIPNQSVTLEDGCDVVPGASLEAKLNSSCIDDDCFSFSKEDDDEIDPIISRFYENCSEDDNSCDQSSVKSKSSD